MTQIEKYEKAVKVGKETKANTNDWIVSMLSGIAESLAVIADHLTQEKPNENIK